jgi:phosphodiesterase/alkaline phosphatase D-like protein
VACGTAARRRRHHRVLTCRGIAGATRRADASTGAAGGSRGRYGGGPTGFEHELRDLLADLDAANVRNIVFANAGPHTAYVFEYRPDANGDGDPLVFHEFVTGPLSADRFPPRSIDSTFGPRPLYAEGGLFNFAVVTVGRAADGRAHLVVETRDENGVVRPTSRIDLVPQ